MATMMMMLSALAAAEVGNVDELLSAPEMADDGNDDEFVVSAGVS